MPHVTYNYESRYSRYGLESGSRTVEVQMRPTKSGLLQFIIHPITLLMILCFGGGLANLIAGDPDWWRWMSFGLIITFLWGWSIYGALKSYLGYHSVLIGASITSNRLLYQMEKAPQTLGLDETEFQVVKYFLLHRDETGAPKTHRPRNIDHRMNKEVGADAGRVPDDQKTESKTAARKEAVKSLREKGWLRPYFRKNIDKEETSLKLDLKFASSILRKLHKEGLLVEDDASRSHKLAA